MTGSLYTIFRDYAESAGRKTANLWTLAFPNILVLHMFLTPLTMLIKIARLRKMGICQLNS